MRKQTAVGVGLLGRDRGLCSILAPATNCMAFICKERGDMTVPTLYSFIFNPALLMFYRQIKIIYI